MKSTASVGRTGGAGGVGGAVPHAVGGDEVVDAGADGEAADVFVLDVDVAPDRAFPQPSLLGQAIVLGVELVGVAGAEGPVGLGDVVAEGEVGELLEAVADGAVIA